jgi:hypothetical protein
MVSLDRLRKDIEALRAQIIRKEESWPPTGGLSRLLFDELGYDETTPRPDGYVLPALLDAWGDGVWGEEAVA